MIKKIITTYKVTWTINIEADRPSVAALEALEILRDPKQGRNAVFNVVDIGRHQGLAPPVSPEWEIDLKNPKKPKLTVLGLAETN